MDVVPFNESVIGEKTIIEDFLVINNGVGEVDIGSNALIGLSSAIIGPFLIDDKVILVRLIVASGLDHGCQDARVSSKRAALTRKILLIRFQS